MSTYGIIPPSGAYGTDWPSYSVLTQGKGGSISTAGWTEESQGYVQQTFLGASITKFNVSAGFGDTTSTLSVSLVSDEYNRADGTPLGSGDDPYHNGTRDLFRPPVVGTPVYFKFGKNFADIPQAYRKTLDDLTGYTTMSIAGLDAIDFPTYKVTGDITSVPDGHYRRSVITNKDGQRIHTFVDKSVLLDPSYEYRGKDHFVFGGILQSWTQSKSAVGGQGYNVKVSDPREILSNVTVLLNNYQGTTYNNKNLLNVYGFLEYDPSDDLLGILEGGSGVITPPLEKRILTKNIDVSGVITYTGDDQYVYQSGINYNSQNMPPTFPITGQGFSRRGDQGIPWYRVHQSLESLFNYKGNLPQEYVNAGFGGPIDFRGYKYVVDFSGLPLDLIPQMYFLDFDQIDLLSLTQELCDVISHDLFVSLLPVFDHPALSWIYNKNQEHISSGNYSDMIAGVIMVNAIDRSTQPEHGAIQSYIQALEDSGIDTDNQDIGFELANITTDKFVVGAQEVDMYYFHNQKDRNNLQLRIKNEGLPNDYELLEENQWSLDTALKQQILPFYGFLGKNAVTIPRGFGAYQQIQLDSSNLFAYGVGNYYIATEMELRCALKSYEDWARFLANYNETYMEDLQGYNKAFYKGLVAGTGLKFDDVSGIKNATSEEYKEIVDQALDNIVNGEYAVSVPRCVFNSERDYMGDDNYPASPCSPPYGYPLYYKRAEKIGIPYAGPASWYNQRTQLFSQYDKLTDRIKKKLANEGVVVTNDDDLPTLAAAHLTQLEDSVGSVGTHTAEFEKLRSQAVAYYEVYEDYAKVKRVINDNDALLKKMKRDALDGIKNSKKVYEFVRGVAEEYLGKKFLVKIPKYCNLGYSDDIVTGPGLEFLSGPFGFKPQPINTDTDYKTSDIFTTYLSELDQQNKVDGRELFSHYLNNQASGKYTYGALRNNFNPISDRWEFNYEPVQDGGFFPFDLYDRPIGFTEGKDFNKNKLSLVTRQMLAPRDITNISFENNRIQTYVRFDNSQFMDLSSISKDQYFQQKVVGDLFIPDILEELDNTGSNTFSLDRIQEIITGEDDKGDNGVNMDKSVAYVSCTVDPQLYLIPKVSGSVVSVYGTNVNSVITPPSIKYRVKKDSECDEMEAYVDDLVATFTPAESGGFAGLYAENGDYERYYSKEQNSWLINTDRKELDPEHVYAIITLPGKIVPTVESRYMDAEALEINAHQIKHNMTQDVVRGPKGFHLPAPIDTTASSVPLGTCENFVKYGPQLTKAARAWKEAMRNQSKHGNYIVNTAKFSPSPVYPDLVAIPLMSKERCYGPWQSASIVNYTGDDRNRYTNIGGKVEFLKDENLAPWNFAGYQLMDEAGKLQAQFSNSLLLFSERGGFVIPEAPTGVALATALTDGGPLVTSINVTVDQQAGIKTTVQMDLYTSSFGKLQKQKEDAIANIARERQRIIDQNNAMIRKNFGKNASKNDFMEPLRQAGNKFETVVESAQQSLDHITIQQQGDQTTIRISPPDQEDITAVDAADRARQENEEGVVPLTDVIQQVEEYTEENEIEIPNWHNTYVFRTY